VPPPQKFFLIFLSENGECWCILHGWRFRAVCSWPTAQESEAEEEGIERALVKNDILH